MVICIFEKIYFLKLFSFLLLKQAQVISIAHDLIKASMIVRSCSDSAFSCNKPPCKRRRSNLFFLFLQLLLPNSTAVNCFKIALYKFVFGFAVGLSIFNKLNMKFVQWWLWLFLSHGDEHVVTDILEEFTPCIFTVIPKKGTVLEIV